MCVWLDHDLQCQCCGIRSVFGVEAVRNVDRFICRLSFLWENSRNYLYWGCSVHVSGQGAGTWCDQKWCQPMDWYWSLFFPAVRVCEAGNGDPYGLFADTYWTKTVDIESGYCAADPRRDCGNGDSGCDQESEYGFDCSGYHCIHVFYCLSDEENMAADCSNRRGDRGWLAWLLSFCHCAEPYDDIDQHSDRGGQ